MVDPTTPFTVRGNGRMALASAAGVSLGVFAGVVNINRAGDPNFATGTQGNFIVTFMDQNEIMPGQTLTVTDGIVSLDNTTAATSGKAIAVGGKLVIGSGATLDNTASINYPSTGTYQITSGGAVYMNVNDMAPFKAGATWQWDAGAKLIMDPAGTLVFDANVNYVDVTKVDMYTWDKTITGLVVGRRLTTDMNKSPTIAGSILSTGGGTGAGTIIFSAMPGRTLNLNATVTIDPSKTLQLGEIDPYTTLLDAQSNRNFKRVLITDANGIIWFNKIGSGTSIATTTTVGDVVLKSGTFNINDNAGDKFIARSILLDTKTWNSVYAVAGTDIPASNLSDGNVVVSGDITVRQGKLGVDGSKAGLMASMRAGTLAANIVIGDKITGYKRAWMDLTNVSGDPNVRQKFTFDGPYGSKGNSLYVTAASASTIVSLTNVHATEGSILAIKPGTNVTRILTNLFLDGNATFVPCNDNTVTAFSGIQPTDPNIRETLTVGQLAADPNLTGMNQHTVFGLYGTIRNQVTVNMVNSGLDFQAGAAMEPNAVINIYDAGRAKISTNPKGADSNLVAIENTWKFNLLGVNPTTVYANDRGSVQLMLDRGGDANNPAVRRFGANVTVGSGLVGTIDTRDANTAGTGNTYGYFTNVHLEPNATLGIWKSGSTWGYPMADLFIKGDTYVSSQTTNGRIVNITGDPNVASVLHARAVSPNPRDIYLWGKVTDADIEASIAGQTLYLQANSALGTKFDLNGRTLTYNRQTGGDMRVEVDPGVGTIVGTYYGAVTTSGGMQLLAKSTAIGGGYDPDSAYAIMRNILLLAGK